MRVPFHPFTRGLWIAGTPVLTPQGALRKARGVMPFTTQTIRSRAGAKFLAAMIAGKTPIGIVRFDDSRYVLSDDGDLLVFPLVGGVALVAQALGSMERGRFVIAPIGDSGDYLFVIGNGVIRKIRRQVYDLTASQSWGIVAPTSFGFVRFTEDTTPIEPYPVAANWIGADGNITVADDATVTLNNPTSLKLTIPADNGNSAARALSATDLMLLTDADGNNYVDSPHDYIAFWLRVSDTVALQWLQLDFDINDGTFAYDTYSARMVPDVAEAASPGVQREHDLPSGDAVATIRTVILQPISIPGVAEIPAQITAGTRAIALPKVSGTQHISSDAFVWKRMLIPKSAFTRGGNTKDKDWNTVTAVRVAFRSAVSQGVSIWLDDFRMIGGSGLDGIYKYQMTYYNSVTGMRSNPCDVPVSIPAIIDTTGTPDTKVRRNAITVGFFPNPTDPQVDTRELWRTIGNSEQFFRLVRLPLNIDEYVDRTGDISNFSEKHNYPSVGTLTFNNSDTGTLTSVIDNALLKAGAVVTAGGDQRTVVSVGIGGFVVDRPVTWVGLSFKFQNPAPALDSEALPLDNSPPAASYGDAEGLHEGRMWWCNDSAAGAGHQVYYSPSGRPESVDSFILVTNAGDQTQRLVRWNASLWCFTRDRIVQIVGETEPFSPRQIAQCPGTVQPFTVVPSPVGIFYQARDGIRLFDGQNSQLLSFESIGPIFNSPVSQGIPLFEGKVAVYARDEYIISDGVTTLAYTLYTQNWREVGLATSWLTYDSQRNEVLALRGTKALALEDQGTTLDDGAAVPFQIETTAVSSATDRIGLVQRVYIEANCNGQQLSPVLIVNGLTVIPLPDFTGNELKTYEFPVNISARTVAVRIAGSLNARVEISRIEMDVRFGPE